MFVNIVTPKLIFAAAVLSAALCFDMPAGHAGLYGNSRWCAVTDQGADVISWNCEYDTLDDCRPSILAGNRGYCSLNSYFHPDPTASGAHPDAPTGGAPNGSKGAR
jgi:hypothetical protein